MDELQTKHSGIIEGQAYIIGTDGHIFLDDSAVSHLHAEIRVFKGRIILRDLNSTNGLHLLKKERYHSTESTNRQIPDGHSTHYVGAMITLLNPFQRI